MRFSLATIVLAGLGNVLFSVNGAPTSLSQRGSKFDISDGLAKRFDIPPKIPKIGPEPVPEPRPVPRPIDPAPISPHGPAPVNPGHLSRPTGEELDAAIPKKYTPKPVPVFGHPYPYDMDLIASDDEDYPVEDPKWGKVYTIGSDNYEKGNVLIDRIGINTDSDSIAIFDAFNKDDKNQPLGQKLFLSDIIMSMFKQLGRNPTDLKLVHVDTVVNAESKDVFNAIYASLGKDRKTDVLTFRRSATDAEKTNFNKITNTPFGLAVDRANQEFSTGKTAQLYTLGPNAKDPTNLDFDILLG